MTDIFVDKREDGTDDMRIVFDDDKVVPLEGKDLFWHIYSAKTIRNVDGTMTPMVIVFSVGQSPFADHNDIPEEAIPSSLAGYGEVDFRWITTLDHEPSPEEWDSFYPSV